MNGIIMMLADAFSVNELTAIVRDISNDKTISDNTIRIFTCALCLSWMDSDDIKDILKEIDDDTLISIDEATL